VEQLAARLEEHLELVPPVVALQAQRSPSSVAVGVVVPGMIPMEAL
jgi:hypothetical protein